jgi:hypothetical protein
MLNFSDFATAQPTNQVSHLKPYEIYEGVTIDSVNITEGTAKTSGNPYKKLDIVFKNDKGIYNHSIFFIDEKDPEVVKRNVIDTQNGGKRELPSRWETVRDEMAVIGFTFMPETFKKIQAAAPKLKTFEDLMKLFAEGLKKNAGKVSTKMKLVGRNNNGSVYATLPKMTGIAQANTPEKAAQNGVEVGQWYTWVTNPFGENLDFTAFELQQKNGLQSAKPTPMADSPLIESTTQGSEDEALDSLLAEL